MTQLRPDVRHSRAACYVCMNVRSTNVVSIRPSTKAEWLKISWWSGTVVLMPSMRSSASARCMQAMASARVAWWTMSLPIIES